MYYPVDKIQPTAGDNSATTKTVRDGEHIVFFALKFDISKYPKKKRKRKNKTFRHINTLHRNDYRTENVRHTCMQYNTTDCLIRMLCTASFSA